MPQPAFHSPFRDQALAASANRRQDLDHLLLVTAPHERMVLAAVGVILAGLGIWALFGSIVRDVTLDGFLIEPGTRHEVVAAEPGYLAEFLVAPGDRVEAGAGIARHTVPELDRETALLRDRVALLESQGEQSGGGAGELLAAARAALLQLEAQRPAREVLVSPAAGHVTALHAAAGEYLPAGGAVAHVREAADRPLGAVLRVPPDMAQRLRPGMPASVEVEQHGGVTHRLEGVVAAVAPLPHWLAAWPPAVAESGRRVDVDLQLAPAFSVPDGTPCRVRIVLGRQAPAALLLGLGPS